MFTHRSQDASAQQGPELYSNRMSRALDPGVVTMADNRYKSSNVPICVCVCVCVGVVCVCVCVYTYIYIYIYTYVYTISPILEQ